VCCHGDCLRPQRRHLWLGRDADLQRELAEGGAARVASLTLASPRPRLASPRITCPRVAHIARARGIARSAQLSIGSLSRRHRRAARRPRW
jgi:hypothetical protein